MQTKNATSCGNVCMPTSRDPKTNLPGRCSLPFRKNWLVTSAQLLDVDQELIMIHKTFNSYIPKHKKRAGESPALLILQAFVIYRIQPAFNFTDHGFYTAFLKWRKKIGFLDQLCERKASSQSAQLDIIAPCLILVFP
jgi:hypothetical protein